MGLSGTFKNRHSNSIGFAISRNAGGKIRRVRCFLQRIACCLDLYGRLLPRKTAEIRPSFECATKQRNDLMSNWPKISCEFETCKNCIGYTPVRNHSVQWKAAREPCSNMESSRAENSSFNQLQPKTSKRWVKAQSVISPLNGSKTFRELWHPVNEVSRS